MQRQNAAYICLKGRKEEQTSILPQTRVRQGRRQRNNTREKCKQMRRKYARDTLVYGMKAKKEKRSTLANMPHVQVRIDTEQERRDANAIQQQGKLQRE